MSGSGASDQAGGSRASHRFLTSTAFPGRRAEADMFPVPSAETGMSPGPSLGQQRQAGRGQRGQYSLPPTGGFQLSGIALSHQQQQQQQASQQMHGYQQQLGYPWFQPRPGSFQQGQLAAGQMPSYGWLPYNVGYQVFGDQLGQPNFLQDSQLHNPLAQYQLPFQGHQDLQSYALGGAQGFVPPTYFPQTMRFPLARGQSARTSKPVEEGTDSYNFDLTEAQENPEQARKTLMLRNIPNKYTIHMLLDMLDKCHKREANELVYDFCYLPIDFKNRCNLGYAFVNFVDAAATAECYTSFNSKRWNDFNSKKVCEVKYARVQGKEALIEHFRNSKFPSNDIDCLPLLFEKVTLESGEQTVRSVPLHSRQNV